MAKEMPLNRKLISIITLTIVIAILIIGFIVDNYSTSEAEEIHSPLEIHLATTQNALTLGLILLGIGVLSWLIVSKILLKDSLKKKKVSSSKKGFSFK